MDRVEIPPSPSLSSSATKPSKPRLVKIRRSAASSRSRQPVILDPESTSRINPFRSDGGSTPTWNPFVPPSKTLNPPINNECVFGYSGKSDQSSSENRSSLNLGVSETEESQGPGFVFTARSASRSKTSSNSSRSSSVGLEEGLVSKVQSEMSKMNLQHEEFNVTNVFVSGKSTDYMRNLSSSSSGLNEVASSVQGKMGKLNLHVEDAEEAPEVIMNKIGENGAFIFGQTSSVEKSSNDQIGKVASAKPGEGLSAKLQEEMGKLNLQSENIKNYSDAKMDSGQSSTTQKINVFTFASNTNSMPTGVSQHSSDGNEDLSKPGEGLSAKLQEEMGKLNLHSEHIKNYSDVKMESGQSSTTQKTNVVTFGSNTNSVPTGVSQYSSGGNEDLSKLPDKLQKMNLHNNVDENGSTHRKQSAYSSKENENMSIFGSSNIATSSFGRSTMEKLPGEMNKLNIKGKAKASNTKYAETDVPSGGFVFGSSSRDPVPDHIPNFSSKSGGKVDDRMDYRTAGCLGRTASGRLSDDVNKLNISEKSENSTGSRTGLSAESASNFSDFTFKAAKQNASTGSNISMPNSRPSATGFTFTSMHADMETTHMEFKTPKAETTRVNNSSMQKGVTKSTTKKKKTSKPRQSMQSQESYGQQFTFTEAAYQENLQPQSLGDYSPMDCSPYQETLAADQHEASMSDESSFFSTLNYTQVDDLMSTTTCMGANDDNVSRGSLENDKVLLESHVIHESSFANVEGIFAAEHDNSDVKNETCNGTISMDIPFSSTINQDANEDNKTFIFASTSEDGVSNFTFAASPSGHDRSSISRRHFRRKDRAKSSTYINIPAQDTGISSSSSSFPVFSTPMHQDSSQGFKDSGMIPSSQTHKPVDVNKKPEYTGEPVPPKAASTAAQEACEKWRLRGNQAYANGNLAKAEECYTRGVRCISRKEASRSCMQALTLCYSNRAATRMSLGRMREALRDCMLASELDPGFVKVQLRAGNCHLALGETQDAMMHFKRCLELVNGVKMDNKMFREASEGLQKAQKVSNFTDKSAMLLLKRTSSDARKALEMISEALSVSPYSENLLEMKAEALLRLRSYEYVIQLCQETLDLSDRNCILIGFDGQHKDDHCSEGNKLNPGRLWRWRLMSTCYFYIGKLEDAIELLQNHERVKPVVERFGSAPPASSVPSLSGTIHELIRLKTAGNEAFQAGQYCEAVEHYSAALAYNTESRPFTAICFCNRAAAYQALGQITDAIADCSLAIALDGSYAKAISRRVSLHEMIRDYGQAIIDLMRLISLLENQAGATGKSNELERARLRLSTFEEEARKDTPLNLYRILGIEPSGSAADVKKAYRKAALRHHPDKARQFLSRSENDDDELWRKLADEVHADADRLFKMIGEAYTTLSDPTKRSQYDGEEEIRTAIKKGNTGSATPRTPKTSSDSYSSSYDRSFSRRQWKEGWNSYGSAHQRWSGYSHSHW